MPKRATNPLSDARWPSTRVPSRSLIGPCRHRSRSRTFARTPVHPSVRPFVHPPAPVCPLSLSSLSRSLSFLSHGRVSSRFLFYARSDHEPAFARLLGRAPSSFAVFLAPPRPHPAGRCALCAMRCAPHCLCAFVRFALCARPSPARRARDAARLGAPRRQVDDAMYVAQTICNDGNRPTPLLSRIRISFHGQRRRPLRKRSR